MNELWHNTPQWITWRATPSLKTGKILKIPLSPNGVHCNPHDPKNWMTRDAAEATGRRLGFVLTENDDFWCLDNDHARDPQTKQWSEWVKKSRELFQYSYFEVSQSLEGCHIIGRGKPGPHVCNNSEIRAQFYDSKRFIAITGIEAAGNADRIQQPHLDWLIEGYFHGSPKEAIKGPPIEAVYSDEEVLKKLMSDKPKVKSIFDGKATVQDLWNKNSEPLEKTYPAVDGHSFDHSVADAALLQHLFYFTKGCREQVERLFGQSTLSRGKWHDREDYRIRSLSQAEGLWRERNPQISGEEALKVSSSEAPEPRSGLQLLPGRAQVEYFKGCVYIRDLNRAFVPDGALLDTARFRATYGGYTFGLDDKNEKTTKSAWEAFTESQCNNLNWTHGSCFRPIEPSGALLEFGGHRFVNTYVPVVVPSVPGNVDRFLLHLTKLFPDDRDRAIMLSFMASVVQRPGVKFKWCPLVQGCEGNGKSLLIRVLSEATGPVYTHLPNAADLGNTFNSWLRGKLFIGVEEIFTRDRLEISEPLKRMITDEVIELHGKGVDQVTGDNFSNWIMNSNHKDAVRKTDNDRRFCVNFTPHQQFSDIMDDGMGGLYFPALYDWLKGTGKFLGQPSGYSRVTHYLQNYKVPYEFDPGGFCHRAPSTSSTGEAIAMSLGVVEQEILEAVEEGRDGFKGGWVSTTAVNNLLRQTYKKISPRALGLALQALGYVHHPGLPGGKVSKNTLTDNARPRLYVREDFVDVVPKGAGASAEIVQLYDETQAKPP